MKYKFYTADVFTDTIFGGNPLAVFPRAEGLNSGQMQKMAAEFNLSETEFVHPPENTNNVCRLRIFTPRMELPFAGHPTISTAHILAEIGEVKLEEDRTSVVFEEGVGEIPITISASKGKPVSVQFSSAKLPEYGPAPPKVADLAAMLSLEVDDLLDDAYEPQAVSCGVPYLLIPVKTRDVLQCVRIDYPRWEKLLANYWAPHINVFTKEKGTGNINFRARMFAPAMGIKEDPATGAAATALAVYLASRNGNANRTLKWTIIQGVEMGRQSTLYIEADLNEDAIDTIRVGGKAVLVSEGVMVIP